MREYEVFPKKRLSQNFMIDDHALELLCSYAAVRQSDIVLEVGAGFGFLTHILAQRSRKVIAVEVDARLVKALQHELACFDNIELIAGNILKTILPSFNKVVSNPPFSISSSLLFFLLDKGFDYAVVTFQKEFAQRLGASVGSKDYSRLTVSTYYRVDVELLDCVPKRAFYPPPTVDAVIVRLKPKKRPPFHVKNEKVFDELIRILFTQRNRKVRKAILPFLHKYRSENRASTEIADRLPFCSRRVRELAPEEFGVLANELSS
ncbi:MAG: 16S rRNA (adenine(1518)-N(6)/adenine(1519)-N(6))-dimethyltransferase RsmA [Candidatus Bathyarchaeia archaeon]